MTTSAGGRYPTRFGFLLLDQFTLISMASAVEPLRMANRISGNTLYEWRVISATGNPITASDGLSVYVDQGFDDAGVLGDLDAIIVCGGERIDETTTDSILRWLKLAAQKNIGMGSVCTGSYALAVAGLLNGYRCSVHWENMAALTDRFREVQVSRSVYTIDRDRYTCSGGTAPVDMMLHFIRDECGQEISAGVAEQFIYERVRRASEDQRVPLKHVIGSSSEKLVVTVDLMEANIREPITQADLAEYAGISRRQLQRLFQHFLGCTPSRYYLRLRLARARELLQQTSMSLVEIASLTGFISSSHFSKSYKAHYGRSPSHERHVPPS
jgi:transcriptional regulator GlxA family with amidase domain